MTWNATSENRFLPSWWEHFTIRLLTDKQKWTESQQKMMSKAGRVHGMRSAFVLVALIALVSIGSRVRTQFAKEQEATRIEGLVGRLVSAEPSELPYIIKELDANSELAATYLSPLLSQQSETREAKRSQLHARLARVSQDQSLMEPLLEELLTNKLVYIGPIRQQLQPYANELTEQLWGIFRDDRVADRRFRAALALANYVPNSEAASWTDEDLKFVAEQLVSTNAEFQPLLRENLRPIHRRLLPDLETIFGDATATEAQRLSAANAFVDYAASDIIKLSELLTIATAEQDAVLYPVVSATPAPSTVEGLGKIAATLPPAGMGSGGRVPYGQRRANAAVTLLRLGERERVLPAFDWRDDPEALTQFIFCCKPRGAGVELLLDLLEQVAATSDRYPRDSRYALLLAIGEYLPSEIPVSRRAALVSQLADWYANDPGSGVHGAAGWLLRLLGEQEIVDRVDQTAVPYSSDREWFTLAITVTPTAPPQPTQEPDEDQASTEGGGGDETATTDEGEDPTENHVAGSAAEDSDANVSGPAQTSAADQLADATTGEREPVESPNPSLPEKTFYYTFIVFPAGDYTIGSVDDERDRRNDELRQPVTLTRPFALLDREITCEELIAFSPHFADDMQWLNAKPADAGFGPDWYHSVRYCRWLGEQMGLSEADQAYASPDSLDAEQHPRELFPSANWAPRNWPLALERRGFRLPTESEWEVANRAGARTTYSYGSDVRLLDRFAWFNENSGKHHVHPPRELRPSVRGLFDMHGNLFEWCHDWLGDYDDRRIADPLGQGRSGRVNRGGNWSGSAANCRSARRNAGDPTTRSSTIGFRLALSPLEDRRMP